MAEYKKFSCPQGDDFEGGYECDRCNKYEICMETPSADVIERSTMEILCNEYLSKCNCCDECCAEIYCILNSLRTENQNCVDNLIAYFTERNIGE